MHIKKLEICGFKSFVDRTIIHFDHDVIGIVGPNGCGKSNIVDAIRWVMGEQSARHLRGRAMADVIFSGSASRGPHGMAEVTLTFDNSDKAAAQELPLEYRDWADIAVTRKLYRDGTSEYLINKTQVRLKDITDLFLGTGVGTKAYSIIEQGKIGLIVSARPEDRRMLIEEAAGITKYKARKKQAEQKMELTRQNLLRVGDIVSEIERNLASLKRQATKAERYLGYRQEVDDLVLHEASHKLLENIVMTQVDEVGRAAVFEEEQVLRTGLSAREAELEVVRQNALDGEQTVEVAQTRTFHADNEVRIHEGEIDKAREKLVNLDDRGRAAAAETSDLAPRLLELAGERDAVRAVLEAAADDEAREAERMQEEVEKLDGIRASESEAAAVADGVRRELSEAQTIVASAQATVEGHERRIAEMGERGEKLEDEDGRLSFDLEDASTRHAAIEGEMEDLRSGKQLSKERKEDTEAELKETRERQVELDKSVDVAKSELGMKRSRLRALEELHERLDGMGQGTKALLGLGDDALRGVVADRFEAPEHLTAAFASLLGERLQWVIVKDVERGVALLQNLQERNAGRATIVPERPVFVAGRFVNAPEGEGIVGAMIDAVRFEPEDEALARSLFGDALVVEDEAVALAWRGRHAGPIVTLSGTVLTPEGFWVGGTGDAVAAGIVEQKREMRVLHETIAHMSDDVTALLNTQQASRLRMTELGVMLDRARNEAHQGELALVTAEKDLKRAEEQVASTQKRLIDIRTQREELRMKLEAVIGERALADARLGEGQARKEAAEGAREEAEARALAWREEVTRQQAVVTERKVMVAQVRERVENARHTADRLSRSCEEMRTRIERLDAEQIECAVAAGQAAAKIMVEREALFLAVAEAQICHDDLTRAKIALDELRFDLQSREVDLKGLRQSVEAASEKLRVHEANLAKLDIERRHLLEGVKEKFRGLELERVVGDYHKRPPVDASHRARIVELYELLDRMGPVNLDAVREHQEAEERYTYYKGQKDDLDKAIADLEQAITQMNRETKRMFRDAFESINARFKALFPKMFRGGSAELRLTNPEEMLETGIEILAQPPGKKLGNIELMSGGEKALTAVSLIFAIFQFKPSPFCILDEVDAPLDEANVTRYNEAIRSMTNQSQFILITHIKRTMQSVDVLYGVTMQEPGVSKLVSVKVNERAEARSRQVAAAASTEVGEVQVA